MNKSLLSLDHISLNLVIKVISTLMIITAFSLKFAFGQSDNFNVSLVNQASFGVSLGPDQLLCPGSGIFLEAGTFEEYKWSDDSESNMMYVTSVGIYWIEVSDAEGNVSMDTIEIRMAEAPRVEFSWELSNAMAKFEDSSKNAESWYWEFGDGQSSEIRNPKIDFKSQGNYPVSLTVYDGCQENTFIQTVNVVSSSSLNAKKILEANTKVYPNPSNDAWFTLDFGKGLEYVNGIRIFNFRGQTIYEMEKDMINQNEIQLDLADYPKGTYFLEISTKEGGFIRKLKYED